MIKYITLTTCAIFIACNLTTGNTSLQQRNVDSANIESTNFEIKEDVIWLNTIINETDTIKTIFDTGALLCYQMSVSDMNKVFPNGRETQQYNKAYSTVDTTNVENIKIVGYEYLGRKILINKRDHSLCGPRYEIDNRMWVFDMENRILTITDSIDESNYPLKYKFFFFKRGNERFAPFVNIPFIMSNGIDSIHTDLCYMLDTGTARSFWISNPTDEIESFAIRANHKEEIDLNTCRNKNYKNISFIVDLQIDGEDKIYRGMEARIFTPTSIRSLFKDVERLNGGKQIVGTIGAQFLKNFNFVIDLRNEQLLLMPVQTNYPSPSFVKYDFTVGKDNRVFSLNKEGYSINNGVSLNDSVVSANGKAWVDYSKREQDSLLVVARNVEWVFEK
ncbi:MAG: hypothetical protein MJZ18_04195 [Bacteroidales bacterium]|nr:hypothetical protein [Bacteroidales bacterium]